MAWWSLWREKPARVPVGDDQTFGGRLVLTDDALYVLPQEKELDVLVALLTYGSMWTAVLFAAGDEANYVKGRHAATARGYILVCRWLGPTGVAIVGGLVVLACIVWLVKRVRQPPLMITLSPSD
jgi:hypothetical protein